MQRFAPAILATLLALAAAPGAAQPVETGALLRSAPSVADYRFERSIVFIVHHDDNGTLGLIINRPTHLRAAETFEALGGLEEYDGRVFFGGPLEATRPLLLVNDTDGALTASDPVSGSIHIVADAEIVRRHASWLTDESRMRVYAGHMQWQPGRLETEVDNGRWRVFPSSADAVFSAEPLELYRRLGLRDSELVAAQPGGGADTAPSQP